MKLFPLLLAFIVLLSGMSPCTGSLACQEGKAAQAHTCTASEDKHSCCQLPAEEDHAPAEEDPCSEGCFCYCCVLVIAPATLAPPAFSQLETDRRKRWEANIYAHEFTHLIWQPPQV